jgi:hypothetical protein
MILLSCMERGFWSSTTAEVRTGQWPSGVQNARQAGPISKKKEETLPPKWLNSSPTAALCKDFHFFMSVFLFKFVLNKS